MKTATRAARWFRRLTLAVLLTLLGTVGAQDESESTIPPEYFSEGPAGKAQAILNLGGHSGAIHDLVFSEKGEKLYTAGFPGEVHEWDVDSGQHLRVWRFPEPVTRLARSRNGRRLAVGGINWPRKADPESSVWRILLETGKADLVNSVAGDFVSHLAFSPEGNRLAINAKGKTTIFSLAKHQELRKLDGTGLLFCLAFHPEQPRLLTTGIHGKEKHVVRAFGLGKDKGFTQDFKAGGDRPLAAWSPEGRLMASIEGGPLPSFHLWRFTEKGQPGPPVWSLERDHLAKQLGKGAQGKAPWHTMGVAFGSETEVLACWEQLGWVRIVRFDIAAQKVELLPGDISRQTGTPGMAFHPDRRLLALAGNPANRIVVYDLNKRQPRRYRLAEPSQEDSPTNQAADTLPAVSSFGPSIGRPRFVGWTPGGNGLVWGYHPPPDKNRPEVFGQGLNLKTLELLKPKERTEAATGALPAGWKLELDSTHHIVLTRPGRKVKFDLRSAQLALAKAFKDPQGRDRLIIPFDQGKRLAIVDPDTGKQVDAVGQQFYPVYDLAVSPDDRYIVVAGGNLTLDIFALAQPRKILLQLLAHKGNWIAWTPGGYYAGTPGGEQWLGWKVAPAPDQPARFYPVQEFKRTFHRPDVLQELLAAGSVAAALQKTKPDTAPRSVEETLPPIVAITSTKADPQDKTRWTIKARVQSRGQKIETLRLLVDGRPLPREEAVFRLNPNQDEATVEARMPTGKVELRVLARGPDASGVSDPTEIEVPVDQKDKPTLHIVSIGINYSGTPRALSGPANDAKAIAEKLATACVGENHLFGRVGVAKEKPYRLLLNEQARAENIRQALKEVRQEVKPRDLLVFFFAGHGVREKRQFYLLTEDANLDNLAKTALSGADLRQAFADCPCQILVLLDACHSGKAGKALQNFQPATDDASRDLTDEECGVFLLAAALGHEEALEPRGGQHGLFTQALLDTLDRSKEVMHNRYDGLQYVDHLSSEVRDQVRHQSKDQQHPVLIAPWTVESFPVRRVAQARKAAP